MSLLARDFLAPFRRRTAPQGRSPLADAEPAAARGRAPRNRLGKQPERRRRTCAFGGTERLEQRLALAVVDPFLVRFTANDTGDITFASNTIMTAPGDSDRAQLARAGIPDPVLGDQILNDDFWDMAYVDIDGDPNTFNSSAADLVLPTDAEVLFAGLYWGGRARGQDQFDNFGNVKFRGPDDAAYRNLSTTIISSTTQGAPSGSGARNYQSFIDVTDIVQAQGEGTYTTANVQAFAGAKNYSAGWSLVVAFREPGAAARNLTVFDGFAYVTTSDPAVDIDIVGFQAPPAGAVTGTLGFVVYEGDLGITGDQARFKSGAGLFQVLSNATNPASNFFNSSISDLGLSVTTKNPNYVNQLGFGADLLAADGLIASGATSATVRLTTTQDFYYPGVITSAIDLYAPKVSVVKAVTDLDGGEVLAGDTLRYTITVSNAASALDAAVGVLLNDALPANTTYVPGSLVITAGANLGSKTDAVDADQGEYLAIEEAVRFQLGTGAGGALPVPAGGRLAPGEFTTVSFDVTIDPDVLAGTIISNTSRASFTAETSRFELFATSNRADVECRPSADLAITKTDGETTAVPGDALTYTIVVTNNGPDPVTGAAVSDLFPATLTDVSWMVSYTGGGSGPLPPSGSGSIATTVNLPRFATATFTVTATINPAATGTLSNTATVSPPAGVTDPNLANNTSTDTTTLTPVANLSIEKSDDPDQVTAGGVGYTYTLKVTNSGFSDAQNVVVVDNLPDGFVATGFSDPGAVTGTDPFTWTIGTLAAGGSAELVVTYSVNADVVAGTYTNTATVTSPTDPTPPPPATEETEVVTGVDLDVSKTGDELYKGGGPLTFTVVVTNLGLSFASGVRVTDALPAGVVNWSWAVSYTGTGSGTADGSPDSVIDSTAGIDKLMDLAVLGTATFTITALTSASFQEDITNIATATIGQESATDSWKSEYDGPINPTQDVGALVVTNDDLCFGLPLVRVLDPETGADRITPFLAYEPNFRGSVRVATGDLTGDGIDEIVVAPGPGRVGQIRVFTVDGIELRRYRTFPFGTTYRGGVDVAVGNIDGIGGNEIIASRSSGLSRVNIFGVDPLAGDPVTNWPIRTFIGIPGAYRNGAVVTAGDYGTFTNGVMNTTVADGIDEIAVGSNAGIRAQVRVFDVSTTPRQVGSFFAIRPGFRGGVTLSSARWNPEDTTDDIIVGSGVGGGSIVEVYGGTPFSQFARLAVFSSFGRPNAVVNAAALDITGDGVADNLYGVQGRGGSGGTRGVRRFERLTNTTSTLPGSTSLAPPLRIAPITLRLLGG
jgi:uncharacterized repeat protein (TIGR01451 family)